MNLPSRYIERVSDPDVTPILYRLTSEGNILINKLKQYGVNFNIPFSGENIVDGKIFFNIPYPVDLYENIHNDYYLIRHRLEIITEGKLGDIIWTMSDNEVSNKDFEIHEDILNNNIRVGDDTEKNNRWKALSENKAAIIFYCLDFTLFRTLYWEIGIQKGEQDIVNFAIDIYKSDWSVIQYRYGIPYTAGIQFWQSPQFITFVIAATFIFSYAYIYPTYFGVGAGTTTASVQAEIATQSYITELMSTGAYTLEEATLIAGGITPATFGGITTLATIGSTLTTAVSVAGTASKYLGGGQKTPPSSGQPSGQPFDMAGILNSMSNQTTQMLLLTLGGFIVFTLISD